MQYLVDGLDELDLTPEDFQAIQAAQDVKGMRAVLKMCVSMKRQLEVQLLEPSREVPLTEVQSWGFVQARHAYSTIADLITDPPVEEPENE